MEDDLKIFKVKYLSNHGLDLTQIWDLSFQNQKSAKLGTLSQQREGGLKVILKIFEISVPSFGGRE